MDTSQRLCSKKGAGGATVHCSTEVDPLKTKGKTEMLKLFTQVQETAQDACWQGQLSHYSTHFDFSYPPASSFSFPSARLAAHLTRDDNDILHN